MGPLYAGQVAESLAAAGAPSRLVTIPPGEKSKRLAVVEQVYDRLFEFAMERSDAVVALGGGVVGDLAGFVAATFKRGVDFMQVPTTLLAMVDSSIGGKAGVNHPRGKNMIGAFHQPRLVFADVTTLRTLPRRELGCGLAETVKHAVIRDAEFFAYLEQHRQDVLALAPPVLMDLVARNCRIKAAVVSADEREIGLRAILNLGHTVGHAIETVLADRDVHHGEAVSLGLVAACRLAVQRGLMQPAEAQRVEQLLRSFELPVHLPDLPTDDLYEAMRHDKKVKGGRITFVLPRGLGDGALVNDVTEEQAKAVIESLRA